MFKAGAVKTDITPQIGGWLEGKICRNADVLLNHLRH